MAFRAAALAKEAFGAARTLVDRVRHQQTLALELLTEDEWIHGAMRCLSAEPISELLTG